MTKKRIPLVRPEAMLPGDVFVETKADGFGAPLFVVEREVSDPVYTSGQSGTATVEGKPNVAGTWVESYGKTMYFATHRAATKTGNFAPAADVTDFVEGGIPVTEKQLTDALIYTESEREDSSEWSTDAKILLDHIRDNN